MRRRRNKGTQTIASWLVQRWLEQEREQTVIALQILFDGFRAAVNG